MPIALTVPYVFGSVAAGPPAHLDGYLERVDLAQIIQVTDSTILIEIHGDSMTDADIQDGDILVMDRSREPVINNVVIAEIDGQFTVKRFKPVGRRLMLVPANRNYEPIDCNSNCRILGVVRTVIRRL